MNCHLSINELKKAIQLEFMSDEETDDETFGADKILAVHKPAYRSEMVSIIMSI